jgi:hypothetical protein
MRRARWPNSAWKEVAVSMGRGLSDSVAEIWSCSTLEIAVLEEATSIAHLLCPNGRPGVSTSTYLFTLIFDCALLSD